jgi:hypothetical protein
MMENKAVMSTMEHVEQTQETDNMFMSLTNSLFGQSKSFRGSPPARDSPAQLSLALVPAGHTARTQGSNSE